jgi:hypothetical protein
VTAVGRGPRPRLPRRHRTAGKTVAAGTSPATGTLETVVAPDDPARSQSLSAGHQAETRPVPTHRTGRTVAPEDGPHLVLPDAGRRRAVGGSRVQPGTDRAGPAGRRRSECRACLHPGSGHRGDPARSPTPRRRVTDNLPTDSHRVTVGTRRSRPLAADLHGPGNGRRHSDHLFRDRRQCPRRPNRRRRPRNRARRRVRGRLVAARASPPDGLSHWRV